MFNIEKAHYILDEMVMNGYIAETNKTIILGSFDKNIYILINYFYI